DERKEVVPADGREDGEDGRGDGRAGEDAREDRGLLRGRSRRGDPVADVDRRADHDDRGRLHGRRDHHRDVPADVQDALARQVTTARTSTTTLARVQRRRDLADRLLLLWADGLAAFLVRFGDVLGDGERELLVRVDLFRRRLLLQ